jgi:hypothetical protein
MSWTSEWFQTAWGILHTGAAWLGLPLSCGFCPDAGGRAAGGGQRQNADGQRMYTLCRMHVLVGWGVLVTAGSNQG